MILRLFIFLFSLLLATQLTPSADALVAFGAEETSTATESNEFVRARHAQAKVSQRCETKIVSAVSPFYSQPKFEVSLEPSSTLRLFSKNGLGFYLIV